MTPAIELAALIRDAAARARLCPHHGIAVEARSRVCYLCQLESLCKRAFRSIRQIMATSAEPAAKGGTR